MKIEICTPVQGELPTGNIATAEQWAEILTSLGHRVRLCESGSYQARPDDDTDVLIALNGDRSNDAIQLFRKNNSSATVIAAMTGTDIYPEPNQRVLSSLEQAEFIVVLQTKAVDRIPAPLRKKTRVIFQSATPVAPAKKQEAEHFTVCVAGHLRDVKDPMRTALASHGLPEDSRILIRHAGGIIEEKYRAIAEKESAENPRYEWIGPITEDDAAQLIASSDLMVISSLSEGGARVVGESVVNGTPILSTAVDGVKGLLGDDYAGYFPVGDTGALTELLIRAETDNVFLRSLQTHLAQIASRFSPDTEKSAWEKLLNEINNPS